jgi:hypothetical protein
MLKKSLKIWTEISIMMFLIVFADFILFSDLMLYTNCYKEMNEIFIGIFILTIIASIYFLGFFFEKNEIYVPAKNKFVKYLKIYWAVLWRALVIVTPVIGIIAVTFHGSIGSRILTIFMEFLAGLPAIWWYLESLKRKNLIH